jgi:hypothetical protein
VTPPLTKYWSTFAMSKIPSLREYTVLTAAQWAAISPTTARGQLYVESDTGVIKVGDGVTSYNSLAAAAVTPTGTQTLTNKTLTSPTITGGTLNNTVIGGTTPAAGTFESLTVSGGNGIATVINHSSTLLDLDADGSTATDLIPPGSLVLGVTVFVETEITGTTAVSFAVGDGSDVDRWGTGIDFDEETSTNISDFTIASPVYYGAATDVVLTPDAGTLDEGRVRIAVHYINLDSAFS